MNIRLLGAKNIDDFSEFDDHEGLFFFSDKKTGLRSFVAVHNTALGPATGGTRCFAYRSDREAMSDALRLSRAMTYKCALAGVPFGGGKGVIFLGPKQSKSLPMLRAYARRIHLLRGSYSTGEDVGLTDRDVAEMEKVSHHVNGPAKVGELGPWAALGVFSAMKSALKEVYGSTSFLDRTFAIKGVGKVGSRLAELIYKEGGKVTIADIDSAQIRKVRRVIPDAKVVAPTVIFSQKVDVYAPCAMGDEFNSRNISELRAQIVCGGANNQLVSASVGKDLHQQGILYVPDYVANAGGLINAIAHLVEDGYRRSWVEQKVIGIGGTTRLLIASAKRSRVPISEAADQLARRIVKKKVL